MSNQWNNTENDKNGGRFDKNGLTGRPAGSEASAGSDTVDGLQRADQDPLGTTLPPAGSSYDEGQSPPFRRLRTGGPGQTQRFDRQPRVDRNNEAYRNDYRQPSNGTSSGGAPRPRSLTGQQREATLDDQAIARMDDEGASTSYGDDSDDLAGARGAYDEGRESGRGARPYQRQPSRRWWQSEPSTVAELMTKDVKTVGPDATVRTVAELMRNEDVGAVPVVGSNGRLVGIVTDRDLVLRGLAGDKSIDICRAKDLATTDIEVASTHDRVTDVIELMGRQQIRRVPVLDDQDRLVGIVSLGDIANRADNDEELQEAFERISGRRSFWSRIWR